MRLAFMGSPEFSVAALHALHGSGHEIAAVYCQPAKPAGRGQAMRPCAVQVAAEALGLPVRTPRKLRRDAAEHAAFAALDLDAAVVAAYGLILPAEMLAAPRRGCLNIHASLLPRWRGAAPIQAAILAGDAQSGVTIMRMDEGLDTGPMLLAEAVPIGPATTAADLHDALAELGARLILRALAEDPPAAPQPEAGATYVAKLSREDGRIDWTRDAAAIERQVRALNPWPGAFTMLDGEPLKVLACEAAEGGGAPGEVLRRLPHPDPPPQAGEGEASASASSPACGGGCLLVAAGRGAVRLTRVQRAGRSAMDAAAFLRGHAVLVGSRLG